MDGQSVSKQANRIVWVDIVKGIGIILVVLGHSNPPVWLSTFISAFHMPLFFSYLDLCIKIQIILDWVKHLA